MIDDLPHLNEVVMLIVSTNDYDYWPEYIHGELIYRVNCEDGIVFLFYCPEEKE